MYKKLLVPLDGSKLAECVLPHVESIASGCGTQEVILISVTEKVKVTRAVTTKSSPSSFRVTDLTAASSGQVPMRDSPIGDYPADDVLWTRAIGKMYNEADRYLDRVQRQLIKKGLTVKTDVLCSNKTAEAIVDYADKTGADLILMASHGRSGISRWASGSVADRVFRSTCVPVLMVRAPGCTAGI
jgi:nucleotide-binding universal stress UspA family protein